VRPDHVWDTLEHVEFLQKIGCIGRDNDNAPRPTAAGILLFGKEDVIIMEFPNYFLDYQEHDDETSQWMDRVVSNTGDWSGNIFDFFLEESRLDYPCIGRTV